MSIFQIIIATVPFGLVFTCMLYLYWINPILVKRKKSMTNYQPSGNVCMKCKSTEYRIIIARTLWSIIVNALTELEEAAVNHIKTGLEDRVAIILEYFNVCEDKVYRDTLCLSCGNIHISVKVIHELVIKAYTEACLNRQL